jgi:hypothetical protein
MLISTILFAYIICLSAIINTKVTAENKDNTNSEGKNKFETKFINYSDNKTKEAMGLNSDNNNKYFLINNNNSNNGYTVEIKDDDSTRRDPLIGLQQSANPFLTGPPGLRSQAKKQENDIDPRLALILQNSPRLQQLARQNPILAQRILRNPALLQDPRIAGNINIKNLIKLYFKVKSIHLLLN